MLQTLLAAWKSEAALANLAELLPHVIALIELVEEDCLKDKSLRNGAIDAICELLQSEKTK
jgi:hypothetical protein